MRCLSFLFVSFLNIAHCIGQNEESSFHTKIIKEYDNGSLVRTDSISNYDFKETNNYGSITPIYPTEVVTIDSAENNLIRHSIWENGDTTKLYRKTSNGETVIKFIADNDTTITVKKKILWIEKTTTYGGDTVVSDKQIQPTFTYNSLFRKKKDYRYNQVKNEWFVETITWYNRDMKPTKSKQRFYSDYWKKYYGQVTKYRYNEEGLILSEIYYDLYRMKEKQIQYLYDKK